MNLKCPLRRIIQVSLWLMAMPSVLAQGMSFTTNTYPVGSLAISVTAADLNGDGKPDLICANYTANTLTILTNNGSGLFGSNATLTIGTNPVFVAAADLKGDHKLDLISANYGADTLTATQPPACAALAHLG